MRARFQTIRNAALATLSTIFAIAGVKITQGLKSSAFLRETAPDGRIEASSAASYLRVESPSVVPELPNRSADATVRTIVDKVTSRLLVTKSLSRSELLTIVGTDCSVAQIEAELLKNDRMMQVGSGSGQRLLLLDEKAPMTRLSLIDFCEYISKKTGLLSGPAISIYIEKHFGWAPNVRNIGG